MVLSRILYGWGLSYVGIEIEAVREPCRLIRACEAEDAAPCEDGRSMARNSSRVSGDRLKLISVSQGATEPVHRIPTEHLLRELDWLGL